MELFKKGWSISKAELLAFRLDMQLFQCRVEEANEKSNVLLISMFGVDESKAPLKKDPINKMSLVIWTELTEIFMGNRRQRKIINERHVWDLWFKICFKLNQI